MGREPMETAAMTGPLSGAQEATAVFGLPEYFLVSEVDLFGHAFSQSASLSMYMLLIRWLSRSRSVKILLPLLSFDWGWTRPLRERCGGCPTDQSRDNFLIFSRTWLLILILMRSRRFYAYSVGPTPLPEGELSFKLSCACGVRLIAWSSNSDSILFCGNLRWGSASTSLQSCSCCACLCRWNSCRLLRIDYK